MFRYEYQLDCHVNNFFLLSYPKIIEKNQLAKYILLKVVNTQFLLSTRDQFVATRLNLEDAQMVSLDQKWS